MTISNIFAVSGSGYLEHLKTINSAVLRGDGLGVHGSLDLLLGIAANQLKAGNWRSLGLAITGLKLATAKLDPDEGCL